MSSLEFPEPPKPPDRPGHVIADLFRLALEATPQWGRSRAFLALIAIVALVMTGFAHTDLQSIGIVCFAGFVILVMLAIVWLGIE